LENDDTAPVQFQDSSSPQSSPELIQYLLNLNVHSRLTHKSSMTVGGTS